jgi:hypothetical protein
LKIGYKDKKALLTTEIAAVRTTYNKVRPARTIKTPREVKERGRPRGLIPTLNSSYSFRQLLRYFIAPLVNAMDLGSDPDQKMTLEERVAFLFGTKHREILMAVAAVDFKMPGLVWVDENPADMAYPSVRQAQISKGTPLMIRMDEMMPERIDIEICNTTQGTMFSLTNAEYRSILANLTEIAGNNVKLMPPAGVL